jgi:hypothetical protein
MAENNNTDKYHFTVNGKPYIIQPEGSLGLLALGYKGLQAWREVKKSFVNQNNSHNSKQSAGRE